MTRSRTMAILGLTAGLLTGGGVALTLGLPSVVGAQSSTTVETIAPSDVAKPSTGARHGHPAGRPGQGRGPQGMSLEAIAPLLGVTPSEVATGLRSGISIAAQAQAAGVPVQSIVDALVAEMSQRLATAVETGRLTQEQADEKLAQAPERLITMLDKVRPAGR